MRAAFRSIAILLVTALPAFGQGAAPQPSALQRLLDAEATRFPGKLGIWVKHLTTGEEAGVRADESFNSASVIKIPVLVLAMQMADKGQLSLAERVTITAADVRGGTGVFRLFEPGLQPTLRDVLMQMIVTSDNTATDLAIAKVGGVDRVNGWLLANGFGGALRLNMTTADLFAKYAALQQGALRNEKTNSDRAYWLGEMMPRATGRLLEEIQRCADGSDRATPLGARATCTEMIRLLRAQQAGARRLPHFINVPIAHKTGDFPPVLANDVGILFTRSGPVVVALFANAIEGSFGEAEDHEGRIAQLIVNYFDGSR